MAAPMPCDAPVTMTVFLLAIPILLLVFGGPTENPAARLDSVTTNGSCLPLRLSRLL